MRPPFVRISTVVWSGMLAFVLTIVAGGIWTALLIGNAATTSAIPWSVVVMGLLLWLMWQYLGGRWGPQRTSAARRRYLRARPLSRPVFAWAVIAGLLALVALIGFWIVLVQLGAQPARSLPTFSGAPLITVALLLIMAALVSALAEEAGFRGYFQGILEGRLSGLAAIVVAALVIAPAHGLTQGFLWPTVLWYFLVDLMLGGMAYLTRSILPGILVHSLGLLAFFALVWPYDAQRPLALKTGADLWFWLAVAQAILGAALAILAFRRLARLTSAARVVVSNPLRSASAGEPAR